MFLFCEFCCSHHKNRINTELKFSSKIWTLWFYGMIYMIMNTNYDYESLSLLLSEKYLGGLLLTEKVWDLWQSPISMYANIMVVLLIQRFLCDYAQCGYYVNPNSSLWYVFLITMERWWDDLANQAKISLFVLTWCICLLF